MTDRRKPKIQIGRRATDIPVAALEQFKNEVMIHQKEVIDLAFRDLRGDTLTKKDWNEYVLADLEWKQTMEPVRKAFQNTSWLFSIFIGALKIIGLLGTAGAAILFIRSFFHRP